MSTKEAMDVLKSETDKISEASSSLELEVGSALFCKEEGEIPSDDEVTKLIAKSKGIVAKIRTSIDAIEAL